MKAAQQEADYYTLVQHSAYGFNGDPHFFKAVQSELLLSRTDVERVKDAGGILAGYAAIHALEYAENFPPEVVGLIPKVRGTFSYKKVNGLRIYIPKSEKEEDEKTDTKGEE